MENKPLRILHFEDLETDAILLDLELKRAGVEYTSKRVWTEEDLRKELKDLSYDILLADFNVPPINALDALRIRKELGRENLPFILVTGTQTDEVATQCLKEGADDYIHKTSASLARLPTAISNVIKKKETEGVKVKLEGQLKDKVGELESYSKEFERFVETGSKDLQESIKKIVVFGHNLKKECGKALGEKGEEYLDKLQAAATRMDQWLNGLLQLFKKHQGKT